MIAVVSDASAYERGRAAGELALRSSLLDVAGNLLASEGPEALSMRRVADAAGCSTAVLYRLFHGKHGIVAGLYREGFDRLRARLSAVQRTGDHRRDLAALGAAYRDHALTHPSYYAVMFGRPVPQFSPTDDDVAHGRRSLEVLADAVADAQADGVLDGDDPWAVARVLWAAAHGAVSLELAGHLTAQSGQRTFRDLTAAAAAHVMRTQRRNGS